MSLRPLLLLVLLTACGRGGDRRPNVLLVTLDTTRPDYLSCYDSRRPPTTTPDALAAEGVRFEAALSSSGVTPVSHATILTGRYQYEHGLRVLSAGSGFRLGKDQPTIARTLGDTGYSTVAVHSAFPVSRYFGFDRDFEHFDDLAGSMERKEGASKTSWPEHLQRRSPPTIPEAWALTCSRSRADTAGGLTQQASLPAPREGQRTVHVLVQL